jgi:4-amino-4-deoxy-L-arabinose transferase-like glycosyltransferase
VGTANSRRSFALLLAAIVAFGGVLRVVHTLAVAPWPPAFFNDEAYYATLGRMLARGTGFVRPAEYFGEGLSLPTAERPPLFPLLLGGLAELGVTGGDARLLGALTGAGTIAALGLLGRAVAGARAGLLAAALAALYPTLIAADGALMTESLYGLLVALALLAAVRLFREPRAGRAALLGVAAGLAALTRGEALVLLVLLLLPLLRRPGGPRAAALACLAFGLVLAPWTIRNVSVFDRPVLVATEGGETLAGANCRQTYYGDMIGTWQVSCARFSGRGNEAKELDDAGRRGIRYAGDHLSRLPAVLAARLARTWGVLEPFHQPEGRARWVTTLGVLMYLVLLPLAAYGAYALCPRSAVAWVLVAPFVTVTLTTLLGYGTPRFRHAAELALVALAAVALNGLLARSPAGRRSARPAGRVAGGAGA